MPKYYNEKKLIKLRSLLRQMMILVLYYDEGDKKKETEAIFDRVCNIVFVDDMFSSIWDETILRQLTRIFETISPDKELYYDELAKIEERKKTVGLINDFFFAVISINFSLEDVLDKLSLLVTIPKRAIQELKATQRLSKIRATNNPAHWKIESLLNCLTTDIGIDFGEKAAALNHTLLWLTERENKAGPNALLVHEKYNVGDVVPLQIYLREGGSDVKCLVAGCDYFEKAIERAKEALLTQHLIRSNQTVAFSLNVTEAKYVGDSIALSAAMGIYAAAQKVPIDPYTAFTGNINIIGGEGEFKVQSIQGLEAKLRAAHFNGCRRIFIPQENQMEINYEHHQDIQIYTVNTIAEVIDVLGKSFEPLPEESTQERKINALQAFCSKKGWQISDLVGIQDGLKLVITPPHLQKITVNVYDTGTHNPKNDANTEIQDLLDILNNLDRDRIPIQSINQTLNINDTEIQKQIQESLQSLNPTLTKTEQYCLYVYTFESEKEKVIVKQYLKGKLMFQGKAGDLFHKILSEVISIYNRKHPGSKLKAENFIKLNKIENKSSQVEIKEKVSSSIPYPHIGTDESGKGDYFGSLVVAGVWINESLEKKLNDFGVKDSKQLSDKRCHDLAEKIQSLCKGKYHIVEISPERYNSLYKDFRKENKTLNHLLAWGHARAIESLLAKQPCSCAVADQFGNEQFIISKLMEKGRKIDLIQTHKGERYTAIAAASILARDHFLNRLNNLSSEFGINLPKGASDIVISTGKDFVEKHGDKELHKIGKLHFKTTKKILETI